MFKNQILKYFLISIFAFGAGSIYTLNFDTTNQTAAVSNSQSNQKITSFALYNASTDQFIQNIENGSVIDLAKTGDKLAIVAKTDPATVGSVEFILSGDESKLTSDNNPTYAFPGNSTTNNGSNLYAWKTKPGNYTLSARAFTGRGLSGQSGNPLAISFVLGLGIQTDTTPPSAPTNFIISDFSTNHVSLSWNPSVDSETGIDSYSVYRNNQLLAVTTDNFYTDNSVSVNNRYDYFIVAKNGVGLTAATVETRSIFIENQNNQTFSVGSCVEVVNTSSSSSVTIYTAPTLNGLIGSPKGSQVNNTFGTIKAGPILSYKQNAPSYWYDVNFGFAPNGWVEVEYLVSSSKCEGGGSSGPIVINPPTPPNPPSTNGSLPLVQTLLYYNNFNQNSVGQYTEQQIVSDGLTSEIGTGTLNNQEINRAYITQKVFGNNVLEYRHKKSEWSLAKNLNRNGGARMYKQFEDSNKKPIYYQNLCTEYTINFSSGFGKTLGGKFPMGINANRDRDGNQIDPPVPGVPNGISDGVGGPIMWRSDDGDNNNTTMEFYNFTYHAGKSSNYGQKDYVVDANGNPLKLKVNQDYVLTRCYTFGDKGVANGGIHLWIDGVKVFEKTDYLWAKVGSIYDGFNAVNVENFAGGGDPSWAFAEDSSLYLDNWSIFVPKLPLP